MSNIMYGKCFCSLSVMKKSQNSINGIKTIKWKKMEIMFRNIFYIGQNSMLRTVTPNFLKEMLGVTKKETVICPFVL